MSNKEALQAYLLKNYGSSKHTKKKHKRKKKKKSRHSNHNESTTNTTILTHSNPIQNINTNQQVNNDDDYVMKMPDLNDGSGWNSNILAPSPNKKRKHNETNPTHPSNTKRIKKQRYDTDTESDSDNNNINPNPNPIQTDKTSRMRYDTSSDSDSDIQIKRKTDTNINNDSDSSDIEVRRKPIKSVIKNEYNDSSDSDIEVKRKNNDIKMDVKNESNVKKEHIKLRLDKKSKDKNEDKMEWASGLTQKYEAFEKAVLRQREKYKCVGVYKDDAERNKELQNEWKNEDPMNKMNGFGERKGSKKDMSSGGGVSRPMYKGKPWSNRYGILPGYRWDGIDRSNGFEKKKLLNMSHSIDRKKKQYRWANSDM